MKDDNCHGNYSYCEKSCWRAKIRNRSAAYDDCDLPIAIPNKV